ncbi:MAG TPA: DUF222 domain-containing protein [Microbacterium sp.]|nr:DUF222 domain-containing protein [Microbacterium sp.]
MTFFESLNDAVARLAVFEELNVDASQLPASASALSDRSVRDVIALTRDVIAKATTLQTVVAGVAAARSGRDRGHKGLVQETGHRNTVEFLRDVTGMSRGDAIRTVKVGQSLLQSAVPAPTSGPADGPDGVPGVEPVAVTAPWHQPLDDAVLRGTLTTAQHAAIRRGLGDPPVIAGRDDGDVIAAWGAAAVELLRIAGECTVEDLAGHARTIRDPADPEGAEARHRAAYDKRGYRGWTDADGLQHGSIVFDPEAGAWFAHLLSTALSPRRGGPRFVAADEKQAADALAADPRTNEQLAYDLLFDLIRAGAKANHADVYGSKDAGVRLITMKDTVTGATTRRDAFGRLVATACSEDGKLTLPGSVLEHALCMTGTIDILTDTRGNPLDLGREARLYDKRQRIAIAARDGGCLWQGCDRPPEMTEVHHIDPWSAGGATDCDRGILLCRHHHLTLHNNGWWITRDGMGPFVLHPPAGSGTGPIVMTSKSPLRWLWDPPPDRVSWRMGATAATAA